MRIQQQLPLTEKITSNLKISDLTGMHTRTCHTLWDTGAGMTSVSKEIVAALNLIPTGKHVTAMYGNGNTAQLPTYDLYVIDEQNNDDLIPLRVALNNNPHFELVIGKDFIVKGEFILRGNNGGVQFEFNL